MPPSATHASDATRDPAMMEGAAILGCLTIPGRPEQVSAARSFVEKSLGETNPLTDVAVLLSSEIVTNAVLHSNSRRVGGTVTITVIEIGGGTRIEVTDEGSELSTPVVKGHGCVSGGHGLFLVQTLAEQWGYVRDEYGTTVWFWLLARNTLRGRA
jgi:anti-sigma regulatory factor (Ser/Thr protein kinase)